MSSENRFDKPPLPAPSFVFRTTCHPAANGRTPQLGEQAWAFSLLLEDGRVVQFQCGRQCRDDFRGMLFQEEADDAAARLLGS